jgi:hypothetical protein
MIPVVSALSQVPRQRQGQKWLAAGKPLLPVPLLPPRLHLAPCAQSPDSGQSARALPLLFRTAMPTLRGWPVTPTLGGGAPVALRSFIPGSAAAGAYPRALHRHRRGPEVLTGARGNRPSTLPVCGQTLSQVFKASTSRRSLSAPPTASLLPGLVPCWRGRCLGCFPPPAVRHPVGSLCQTTLGRTGARAPKYLSRYPHRVAIANSGWSSSATALCAFATRLCRWRYNQGYGTARGGVPASLFTPCRPSRLRTHPPLRPVGQSLRGRLTRCRQSWLVPRRPPSSPRDLSFNTAARTHRRMLANPSLPGRIVSDGIIMWQPLQLPSSDLLPCGARDSLIPQECRTLLPQPQLGLQTLLPLAVPSAGAVVCASGSLWLRTEGVRHDR